MIDVTEIMEYFDKCRQSNIHHFVELFKLNKNVKVLWTSVKRLLIYSRFKNFQLSKNRKYWYSLECIDMMEISFIRHLLYIFETTKGFSIWIYIRNDEKAAWPNLRTRTTSKNDIREGKCHMLTEIIAYFYMCCQSNMKRFVELFKLNKTLKVLRKLFKRLLRYSRFKKCQLSSKTANTDIG